MEIDDFVSTSASVSSESAPADTKTSPIPASVKTDEKSEASGASEEVLENEADEVAEGDDEGDEDSGAEDDKSSDEGKNRKKNGLQKRFGRFKRQLSEKEQEIARLNAELARHSSSKPSQNESALPSKDSEGKPNPDDYPSSVEYLEAVADWKLEQREKANKAKEQAEQLRMHAEKVRADHTARVNEFKKTAADYDDVIAEFIEEHGDVRFSVGLEEAVLTSDMGPAVIYELAKDKKEFDRINSLSPIACAREIGRIESRLKKASEAPSETKTKTITKASAPPKHINAGSSKIEKSLDEMDFDSFYKKREEQTRRKK